MQAPNAFAGITLPEYDGSPTMFREYINKVRLYFVFPPQNDFAEDIKVALVAAKFTGKAALWVAPLLEQNMEVLNHFDEFFAALRETFDLPDRTNMAALKIKQLRHTPLKATDYATQFAICASDLQWNEPALIDAFENGLEDYMTDMIAREGGVPDTLQELSRLVIRLDNRLIIAKERNRTKKRDHPADPGYPPPLPPRQPAGNADMMDLGAMKRSPDEEERKRRQDLKLCFFCGSDRHYCNRCPKAPRSANLSGQGKVRNY